MTKYIKGEDGKFNGSVGDGRDQVPTTGAVNPYDLDDAPVGEVPALDTVRHAVTPVMLPQVNRERRGHEFYPQGPVPDLYEQDGIPTNAQLVHAHYFVGGCDWYITEWDARTGQAFGWCDLGMGGEWGYVNLVELEGVLANGMFPVERDCYWTPTQFGELDVRLFGH